MDPAELRRRLGASRVATLATVGETGRPYLVPVTFVLHGDLVWSAVDGKPKRDGLLQRHRNIAVQPRVSLLAQEWSEDWAQLWWVRADGMARVTSDESTVEEAVRLLRAKYPQYHEVTVGPPIIEVAIDTWHGWHP